MNIDQVSAAEQKLAEMVAEDYAHRTDSRMQILQKDEHDAIHRPSHYRLDGLGIEVKDVIKSVLSPEEFKGYCLGNVIKYILRAKKKNGIEDVKKARVYIDWIIGESHGQE